MKKGEYLVRVCGRPEDLPDQDLPELAITGRSNVGKSSLLNLLLGKKEAHVSKTPGKTRTINFYRTGRGYLLVDLPGYGFAKVSKDQKDAWGRLVQGYLAGRKNLFAALLLIDSRHPPSPLDRRMQEWFSARGIQILCVATKSDQVPRGQHEAVRRGLWEAIGNASIPIQMVSCQSGEGEKNLRKEIQILLNDFIARRSGMGKQSRSSIS